MPYPSRACLDTMQRTNGVPEKLLAIGWTDT